MKRVSRMDFLRNEKEYTSKWHNNNCTLDQSKKRMEWLALTSASNKHQKEDHKKDVRSVYRYKYKTVRIVYSSAEEEKVIMKI